MPKGLMGFQKGHENFRKDLEHSFYKSCLNCNKEFKVLPRSVKRGGGKYCSHKCCSEYCKKTGILNGRIPWNKGLTGKTDQRIAKSIKALSEHNKIHPQKYWLGRKRPEIKNFFTMKGKTPWNKNLTKETDERVLKYANSNKGEKSRFWKGGISDLRNLIRNIPKYRNWRMAVYRKDGFLCRECGEKSNKFNAHHIKPFSDIFQEFLHQYSQFSPIEDKETLLRLSLTYEPFWDVDNGITLCKKCHNEIKVEV
ncbi:MAG: HNH endonuclease [Planctomycetota bacterium]